MWVFVSFVKKLFACAPPSLAEKKPSDIWRALLLKHAAALRMTLWHLTVFGWEEFREWKGACDGPSQKHTCEASVIYKIVIRVLFPQCSTCCIFSHGTPFGLVFTWGSEIRLETWEKSHPSTQWPKHMILRFCVLYLKLFHCVQGCDRELNGAAEPETRSMQREGEEEQCQVLLSCLSVAGGGEQRKLVGCGVSHVCLTLSDSLLLVTHTLRVHSLWEMCDSFAFVLPNKPNHTKSLS